MVEFNGTPFQYNPAITNVNIDNQLAGVLSQFSDDYIMDVVKQSIQNRVRLYSLPAPNVVAAFESTFKQITDGFASYTDEIMATRKRVYTNIIDIICDYFGFRFNESDDTDYYSAAYWLYEIFISKFTDNLKNFYALYMIKERDSIYNALGLDQMRKENDTTLMYAKKIFKDPKIASIYCDMEYVISQMETFPIDFGTIVDIICANYINLSTYIKSLVTDETGMFFQTQYQAFILGTQWESDILTYIKLYLQEAGKDMEPV